MPVLNLPGLIENRVLAITAYHNEQGLTRAELDISGGVDSAVMLGLLVRAVGPKNITAVFSDINSSATALERAREVTNQFGVHLMEIDANNAFALLEQEAFEALPPEERDHAAKRLRKDPTVLGSLRSTLRAPIGRFCNRLMGGGLRHGTGNECEDRWLRFFQKGGDGEVDTNPIAMLSKTEVFQLAVGLGVPQSIIRATPSPDLWAGESHSDEDELRKLSGGVAWTYGRVNPETGECLKLGSIERMSRFFDSIGFESPEDESVLTKFLREPDEVITQKLLEYKLSRRHLASAIRWEKSTRHKWNPNCPMLGDRWSLETKRLVD